MEVAYVYTKARNEFGKKTWFKDVAGFNMECIPPRDDLRNDYILAKTKVAEVGTAPHMSEHEVCMEKVATKSTSMRHVEGGWPKDVDFTEPSDVNRFRKKAEKDEEYKGAVKSIGPIIGLCMRQNNTVNIFEEYFEGDVEHSNEPPSAKGLAVFRDPVEMRRTATSINWHPDGSTKIAVSYSVLNFQDPNFRTTGMPTQSYVWDIVNPNTPDVELLAPNPLCCLRYNPKSTETLVGGSYNGLVNFFDLRKPGAQIINDEGLCTKYVGQAAAIETSIIENSHHDPVYDVFWISSKTGNQCCSVSTDGQLMWWDTRRLECPTDVVQLTTSSKKEDAIKLGGSCMEYNPEAGPTKYLVGTEQGIVMQVNLRNRKQNNGVSVFDMGHGKHKGPICSIQRNPTQSKYFMTVGDWTAKIWIEDLKTPIITTKYHASYLTSGCWSPTRVGVFFVTRMDGVVDIWDCLHGQNEATYSHKVGAAPLSSIAVQDSNTQQGGGKLVACGDQSGTVSLLELCDSLSAPSRFEEKSLIGAMFEREAKREKNLEQRERDYRRLKAKGVDGNMSEQESEKRDETLKREEELVKKAEAEFYSITQGA